MEWQLAFLLILGSLVVLMATGMPVAFSFMTVNLMGVFIFFGGETGLRQLILSIYTSVTTFALLPVPLFVLMGEVMFQSGIAPRMMDALDKWLGRLPGRLSLLTVGAATMLSTMSGSSLGTTAMLGALLVPEMEKRGYKKPMSIGPILGSGGLAIIIPPSALAVLLASLAYVSIGKLLIAGVIPGIIIAFFYAGYISIRCLLQPSLAPSYVVTPPPLSEKLVATARDILPLGFIVFMVLGLIFLGIATPTEAAATGAVGAAILALVYRRLNWDVVKRSVLSATQIAILTLMIITGSTAFSQILAGSGASKGMVDFMVSFPLAPIVLIIIMQLVLLVLGCFMDVVSMIMITLPIYMPIVNALGFNPVWFALLMLINMSWFWIRIMRTH